MISSLIQNLPEGSRFRAAMAYDRPDESEDMPELDPRVESIADRRSWTLPRRLQAMEINAINMNTAATGNWKNGPPDFPTIGPADWQGPPAVGKKTEPVYKDNFDLFKRMGWPSA